MNSESGSYSAITGEAAALTAAFQLSASPAPSFCSTRRLKGSVDSYAAVTRDAGSSPEVERCDGIK